MLFNPINPKAHKHTRPALDWAFLGWFWVWDPAQAGRRCEMCERGEMQMEVGAWERRAMIRAGRNGSNGGEGFRARSSSAPEAGAEMHSQGLASQQPQQQQRTRTRAGRKKGTPHGVHREAPKHAPCPKGTNG